MQLLVIEDENEARGATQLLLEQHGAHVRAVGSAALAREALAVWRPDAIVADIGMPDEDGYAFLAGLRQAEKDRRLARIPAVAVTAFARIEDRERALTDGFDDHVAKPLDAEELVRSLSRLRRSPD